MSRKNPARSRLQIQRKKKVLQRMRTRELREGLTAKAVVATLTNPAQADSKTEHAQ